jgi:cytochrome c-type biogenesis protein CcmH
MLFWLIAASLTLIVTVCVVAPLFRRRPREAVARERHDAEVYRAQLSELDADLARGIVRPEDAVGARAEIGRRLLRAAGETGDAASPPRRARAAAAAGLAVALLLPVGTFLFYDRAGSPEIPDQPFASREPEAAPATSLAAVLDEVERRLAASPDDGRGWSLVAPIYLQSGQSEKAVAAFRNALRLAPATAQAHAGLGEALVQQAGGIVTPEAEAAFREALSLDPQWPPARFYLALQLSQEGRLPEAREAWSALIATSPADAPWLTIARAALADATSRLAGVSPSNAQPGPSAADVAAAQDLAPDDRNAMIEGMVSQLAARLQTAPNDVEGWKRLMRSYTVLGDIDAARAAKGRAEAAFPLGSREHQEIEAFAQGLGWVEPEETSDR